MSHLTPKYLKRAEEINRELVAIAQTPATKHLQRQIDELTVKVKALNMALNAAAERII